MEKNILFDITLNVLKLIIDLYEKKEISYEEFVENSIKKVTYIKHCLEASQSDEEHSNSRSKEQSNKDEYLILASN